jgi:NTE family protein
MADTPETRRIAIGCQAGGSHTAFTAGVLQGLLERISDDMQIVALSGTSGGAFCALLAWDSLLRGDRCRAVAQLERFWRDNTASSLVNAFLNLSVQMAMRLRPVVAVPQFSPYVFPSWPQEELRRMLERRVNFDEARSLAAMDGSPGLVIGAVDVLNGKFEVFRGAEISAECILGSAAVPEWLPAVACNGSHYWDGLFSQNPPIRELTDYRPDEIWLIQINKTTRQRLPISVDDIYDRHIELSGSLSLEQELRFIEKVNKLLKQGVLVNSSYRPIEVHRIALDLDLDFASKLDRSESFIQGLMAHGRKRASQFMDERKNSLSPSAANGRAR